MKKIANKQITHRENIIGTLLDKRVCKGHLGICDVNTWHDGIKWHFILVIKIEMDQITGRVQKTANQINAKHTMAHIARLPGSSALGGRVRAAIGRAGRHRVDHVTHARANRVEEALKQSAATRPKSDEVSVRNVNVDGQDETLADVDVHDAAARHVTRHDNGR